MYKHSEYKIKSSIPTNPRSKKKDTTRLTKTTIMILLTCMITAPYIANYALGLTVEKTAIDSTTSSPQPQPQTTNFADPSSIQNSSQPQSQYTNASPLTQAQTPSNQNLTIALHLRTHIFSFFTQPVSIKVTNTAGVDIGPQKTTTVSPLKEKIVYLEISSATVKSNGLFQICLINLKYGKEECQQQQGLTDEYMTVP